MEAAASPPKKRKIGRPCKPLSERKFRLPKTSKTHKSVPREEKLNVILYILDNKNWVQDFRPHVRIREGQERIGAWRPPNNLEVSQAFHGRYSPTTIGDWWKKRDLLNESRARSRRLAKGTKLAAETKSASEAAAAKEAAKTADTETDGSQTGATQTDDSNADATDITPSRTGRVKPITTKFGSGNLGIANRFVVYTAPANPPTSTYAQHGQPQVSQAGPIQTPPVQRGPTQASWRQPQPGLTQATPIQRGPTQASWAQAQAQAPPIQATPTHRGPTQASWTQAQQGPGPRIQPRPNPAQ